MAGKSDLIQVRLKLLGGRQVVVGLEQTSKATEKVGRSTSRAATKSKAASRATSGLTRSYKEVGKAARWGLGFLGVGGVLAIESSIHATEELAKTTTGLSRNLGFQTNVASRWGAVAQAREIDTKSLNMAFGSLSTRMVEAGRKGGTLLTPFHQLGISQEEVSKGARDFQWGLLRVAQALGDEEGGAKRATAAKALLGRGYQTLLPLFSEGVVGLKEQLHWADEYGVTLNGHTNEAIMEMVSAQRENKVAMLGLQVSLTKALMPAIHAGDEELQKFIKTLNSPNLTAEQKISRISHQFLLLEGDLIHIIEQALPHVAEQGGRLGLKLAGAVFNGFMHSDLLGKLVISAWLVRSMGGWGLIKGTAERVGSNTGKWTGRAFVAGALIGAALIGYELGQFLARQFPETGEAMRRWGINAGQNFVNALIAVVNIGIDGINEALDKANALAVFGVDAPSIGHVGEVNWENAGKAQPPPPGSGQVGWGEVPAGAGKHHIPPQHSPAERHRQRHHHPRPRAVTQSAGRNEPHALQTAPRLLPLGRGGNTIVIDHKTILDGKVVAESVAKHALDAAAMQ